MDRIKLNRLDNLFEKMLLNLASSAEQLEYKSLLNEWNADNQIKQRLINSQQAVANSVNFHH